MIEDFEESKKRLTKGGYAVADPHNWIALEVGDTFQAGDVYCSFVIPGNETGVKPGDKVRPELVEYNPRRPRMKAMVPHAP